jgi:hypothetical protein
MNMKVWMSPCVFLVAAACSQDTSRTTPPPTSGQDGSLVVDGAPSDANQGAADSSLDASHDSAVTDADTTQLDAGGQVEDAGLSPSLCNPRFGAADACGGSTNVFGTWTYVEGCLDPSTLGMVSAACQGATLRNERQVTSGSMTFTSTFTYRRDLTDDYSVDIDVPAICVSFVGNCAGIESTILFVAPQATANCPPTGNGGCDCHVEIKKRVSDRGSFTIPSPGVSRFVPDDSTMMPGEHYFCVDNDILSYAGTSTGSADHSVTYVLTR